jgi:hypothetical protein
MLELYETFTLSYTTGEKRGFDRGEVLRGDAGEFDRNRAKYDEVPRECVLECAHADGGGRVVCWPLRAR